MIFCYFILMNKRTEDELLRLVKDNYNMIAEEYAQTRRKELWAELRRLAGNIEGGDKILDVGCGSGRLLEAVKKKKVVYLGVDNSREIIHAAQGLYLGYRFVEGDILDLSVVKEIDFDHVFCVAVLQHIPGERLRLKALKQLKNKMAADGRVVITVWNMWSSKWAKKKFKSLILRFALLKFIGKNHMDFGDILFDWKSPDGEKLSRRYYHAFTKRQLKRLFKRAGLKIDRLYKDKRNYYAILKK